MRAMILRECGPLGTDTSRLTLVDWPMPSPSAGELLIRVSVCGVCHTELDIITGRMPPKVLPIILGHQVVGRVVQVGSMVSQFRLGERVGVGWIHHSSGQLHENVQPQFVATGRDVHGGYAEYLVAQQQYAFPVPEQFTDSQAAPLLCAGAIGYRALKLSGLADGQRLGLMGFGASAHLVMQLVKYLQPQTRVYVFARETAQRDFALKLGAIWAGGLGEASPELLDAVIDTTPAWWPVLKSLENLRPAGRLVINAIRKESADQACLMQLSYQDHLWLEKEIKTVANITQYDLREYLPLAASAGLRPEVTELPLAAANEALMKLAQGGHCGALVLRIQA